MRVKFRLAWHRKPARGVGRERDDVRSVHLLPGFTPLSPNSWSLKLEHTVILAKLS